MPMHTCTHITVTIIYKDSVSFTCNTNASYNWQSNSFKPVFPKVNVVLLKFQIYLGDLNFEENRNVKNYNSYYILSLLEILRPIHISNSMSWADRFTSNFTFVYNQLLRTIDDHFCINNQLKFNCLLFWKTKSPQVPQILRINVNTYLHSRKLSKIYFISLVTD